MDDASQTISKAPDKGQTKKRLSSIESILTSVPEHTKPLNYSQVEALRQEYGPNSIITADKIPCYMVFLQAFFHPFNILLILIAVASYLADLFSPQPDPGDDEGGDYNATSIIIGIMVVISTILRFWQEWKSVGAVHSLLKLVSKSVTVVRYTDQDDTPKEMGIPSEELVPGDWFIIRPGEVVPADSIVLNSKVFFVSQAPLTGEAIPVEKYPRINEEGETDERVVKDEQQIFQEEEQRSNRITSHKPMPKFNRFFRLICGMKVKTASQLDKDSFAMRENLTCPDQIFMGCQVITGIATARVVRTGPKTLFGKMADALANTNPSNPFQQGVRRISWVFFLIMAIMIPPVFILKGIFGQNWGEALTFSLAVAVGLTPEMLPMIVNANLAKGTTKMAAKNSIVKTLDSIINLGAVDVLCTDKTGTLTKSIVHLSTHLNPYKEKSNIPINIGYLNAYFQSNTQNPLDTAITAYFEKLAGPADPEVSTNKPRDEISEEDLEIHTKDIDAFLKSFGRLDELPFDFVRRRLSILIRDNTRENHGNIYLVCKGAAEETLSVCSRVISQGTSAYLMKDVFPPKSNISSMDDKLKETLLSDYFALTEDGHRVLAVAYKPMSPDCTTVKFTDESDMVFVGFLTFIDPPKETTREAIAEVIRHNIEVKILTGDSPNICNSVCKQINLPVKAIVTGEDIDKAIENGTVAELAICGTIFAKLTPLQKSMIVHSLKTDHDRVVAFMGDGVNDAPALKEADVGISVDTGVDICRESADVILLDKDLNAVVTGVRIGRETYGNTLKYIAMGVSSNFGNVFSVLVAAAWFVFEPMTPLQLLVQNLLYDISQIAIPWDTMDEEFLMVSHKWKTKSIIRFMIWMGPWSSVFDIATFVFSYFVFGMKPFNKMKIKTDKVFNNKRKYKINLFRTTWFTVGLLTQTLIVHMIRTPKLPFIQSRASRILSFTTVLIMGIGLAIPFIPEVNKYLGFTNGLPPTTYGFVAGVLLAYCVAANVAKLIYVKIFKEWF